MAAFCFMLEIEISGTGKEGIVIADSQKETGKFFRGLINLFLFLFGLDAFLKWEMPLKQGEKWLLSQNRGVFVL